MMRTVASIGVGPAVIDFDDYTPFTVTWPGAAGVSGPPVHGRVLDSMHGMLEMTFDPDTSRLVEVVLVTAPRVAFSDAIRLPSGHPPAQVEVVLEGPPVDSTHDLEVTAFRDVLLVTWSDAKVAGYAEFGGVLIGLDDLQEVVALGLTWGVGEREAFESLWPKP